MIRKILIGNIFDSKAQTLINTVNCVGVMGKGIALEFKNKFPEMFKEYKERCKRKEVSLGKPYFYKRLFPPNIINFPTKDNWNSISRIQDIRNGLDYIVDHYKEWEIESLAVPPLGCGNGQLDWRDVGPIIFQTLDKIDIPVDLYAPYSTPKIYLTREFLSQVNGNGNLFTHQSRTLNPAWLALVEILYQLEKHPYHQPVGRTIFNKIGYFATEQNLPTNFKFREGSFGPFSPDIKRAITVLANNGLIMEEQKGQMFKINVGPNYDKFKERFKKDIQKYSDVIHKTVDLFARMNTQQAEITTTVLFSTEKMKNEKRDQDITECDVFKYVMEWKKRRKPSYDKNQLASAIRHLASQKWINVRYSEDLPLYQEI